MLQEARHIHLIGATGQIRTAKFREKDHVVVPVVALVEGVLHAVNSPAPELVLIDEVARSYKGWNGRPIVAGHPTVNGVQVSANDPEIMERWAFGHTFNAAVEGKKLTVEAWLELETAQRVGDSALEIIERLRANEIIEVSVGAFIASEKKKGVHDGKPYHGIWREVISDHLAFLPKGEIGACSVEAGCGTPRAATVYLVTNSGLVEQEPRVTDPVPYRSLKERLFDKFKFTSHKGEEDMSDVDFRRAIDKALRGSVPGYLGIVSVFHADNQVVYEAMPGDKIETVRRSFKTNEDGTIKLKDDTETVEPVTRFEPVNASSHGGCSCGGNKHTEVGETHMHRNAARIKALIDNKRSPFTTEHQPILEACTDEQFKALEDAAKEPEQPATPPPAQPPATPPADAPPATPPPATPPATPPTTASGTITAGAPAQTEEQYINAAPAGLRDSLREGLRIAKERRATILAALKATNRCDIPEAELAAMSTDGLERLLKLADVPAPASFAGLPVAASAVNTGRVSPPPDMVASIRAAKKN